MALGDAYITNTDLKTYLGISDTGDDALLTAACVTATAWINNFCGRQFNKTTTASARHYRAAHGGLVHVHDFHTVTDLVVKTDTGDNGTYDTTWASGDYVLTPLDGIEAGVTGFPFRSIAAVEAKTFPCSTRPRVQVTAQWGWAAVPAAVTQAAQIVGAYVYNLKSSPMGVASFGDAGVIRVREIPQASMLLGPYQHPDERVKVA